MARKVTVANAHTAGQAPRRAQPPPPPLPARAAVPSYFEQHAFRLGSELYALTFEHAERPLADNEITCRVFPEAGKKKRPPHYKSRSISAICVVDPTTLQEWHADLALARKTENFDVEELRSALLKTFHQDKYATTMTYRFCPPVHGDQEPSTDQIELYRKHSAPHEMPSEDDDLFVEYTCQDMAGDVLKSCCVFRLVKPVQQTLQPDMNGKISVTLQETSLALRDSMKLAQLMQKRLEGELGAEQASTAYQATMEKWRTWESQLNELSSHDEIFRVESAAGEALQAGCVVWSTQVSFTTPFCNLEEDHTSLVIERAGRYMITARVTPDAERASVDTVAVTLGVGERQNVHYVPVSPEQPATVTITDICELPAPTYVRVQVAAPFDRVKNAQCQLCVQTL